MRSRLKSPFHCLRKCWIGTKLLLVFYFFRTSGLQEKHFYQLKTNVNTVFTTITTSLKSSPDFMWWQFFYFQYLNKFFLLTFKSGYLRSFSFSSKNFASLSHCQLMVRMDWKSPLAYSWLLYFDLHYENRLVKHFWTFCSN